MDWFASKVCKFGKEIPVGHLPKEISRVTKYLLDRGATATATLTREHYRRSPLMQGGLEYPCKVSVTMPGTVSNLLVGKVLATSRRALYRTEKWGNPWIIFTCHCHGSMPSSS